MEYENPILGRIEGWGTGSEGGSAVDPGDLGTGSRLKVVQQKPWQKGN